MAHDIPSSLLGIQRLPDEVRLLLTAACDPAARPSLLWRVCLLIREAECQKQEQIDAHRLSRFLSLDLEQFLQLPANELDDLLCYEMAGYLRRYLSSVLAIEEIHQYWEYTVACGVIARRLAPLCELDPVTAFAGGLIHDLGRLVLMVRHGERYANLLTMARRSFSEGMAVDLRGYERNLFGMDRYSLGTILADDWHLPPQLKPLLGEFDREAVRPDFELVDLIRGSCQIAHCLNYGFLRGGERLRLRQVLAAFPAAVNEALDENPTLIKDAAREGLQASALWLRARA